MSKIYFYYSILIGGVCIYFLVHTAFFPQNMILRNAIIQGVLIGFGLAFVSAQIYARIKSKKVNGWVTMYGLGRPSNGLFLRAAHAQLFPGPVNRPEEAMYWWTNSDEARSSPQWGTQVRDAFPGRRTPAEQSFLVDHDGKCEEPVCGE